MMPVYHGVLITRYAVVRFRYQGEYADISISNLLYAEATPSLSKVTASRCKGVA